jgi:serine/threonine-protein kinase HipA
MTLLYDVLRAQPSVDNMQIARKKFKLAMSVGAKRHYAIDDIMPRHFLQTAAEAGISVRLTTSIFDALIANASRAVDQVLSALPKGFPTGMAAPIAAGFSDRLRQCELRGG